MAELGDGAQVNLSNEMTKLTLEVITQTMFSTSVLDKIERIAPSLETLLRYAAKTLVSPLTLPLYVPTPANQKFKQALGIIDDVIYGIIEQRRKHHRHKMTYWICCLKHAMTAVVKR